MLVALSPIQRQRLQSLWAAARPVVPVFKGRPEVELTTTRGVVKLELDGDAAPVTAGNFVDLVKRGVYDGTVFHRVIREPVPFVVQGGDPTSSDPNTSKSQYGTGKFCGSR